MIGREQRNTGVIGIESQWLSTPNAALKIGDRCLPILRLSLWFRPSCLQLLADLARTVLETAARLSSKDHEPLRSRLAVRTLSMHCYHSNLSEGHKALRQPSGVSFVAFMQRKEFLTTAAATLGSCLCGGALLGAETPSAEADSPEVRDLRQKIEFMQKRMARLVAALDAPTRSRVLETMGRECAKEFASLTERFRGKPREFLDEARRQWMKEASYDPATGTVRVVDRAAHCTCAFVRPGLTPADFCACTLGWQKEAYATILGEPVDAELESSVLRGDSCCAFRMRARRG